MPRGKTPSLIGSSLGRPKAAVAGRGCSCSRCKAVIAMDDKCYDVPRPSKPFASTRRLCLACYLLVLDETARDLAELRNL